MKKGDRLPQSPGSYARLKVFNQQLVLARQAAEWGMRSLQGSFARLKLPLLANDHQYRGEILELAVRLHQVRCQTVHINQTQRVYEAVQDDFNLLTRSFHRMIFSDIQQNCRISRYYHGWM